MRFLKILWVAAFMTSHFGSTFAARATENHIVHQILQDSLFKDQNGSMTVFFTRNGGALISAFGTDELTEVSVDDNGTIEFVHSSRPEFHRLWRYDSSREAVVSFDGRLILTYQKIAQSNPPTRARFGTPGCAPGRCH